MFRDGMDSLSLAFVSAEKRLSWEEAFTEAKLKLRGKLLSFKWIYCVLIVGYNFKIFRLSLISGSTPATRIPVTFAYPQDTSRSSIHMCCSNCFLEFPVSAWYMGVQQWWTRWTGQYLTIIFLFFTRGQNLIVKINGKSHSNESGCILPFL